MHSKDAAVRRAETYLSPDDRAALDALAARLGLNRSAVLRMAVRDLLRRWPERDGR
jgi:predicted transcriptional regulator